MVLRFGMVGGGNGAFIGDVHRHGASFDDFAVLSAGCFTRDAEQNRLTGEKWRVDPDRVYSSHGEMAEKEARRGDGIHFVCIATPNDSHFDIARSFMERGIHIMCDKPLALNLEQAVELARLAREKGVLFGLTFSYAGYAAIRQIREMVDGGLIGDILHVTAEYPQDWVISSLVQKRSDQALWRFDPERVGSSLCTGDIGTHLHQLVAQSTGLRIRRVLARFDTYPRHLPLETNTTVLLDFGNGASGTLWASQIAIGFESEPRIRVFGAQGSLEWSHARMGKVRYTPINSPTREMSVNREYMSEASNRLCRLPAGHPEGFYEAFGNIYHSFCRHLLARIEGGKADNYTFPTVEDGVDAMRFVKACVESDAGGNVWIPLE
ncbi:MAG: Gfo/Idh/MocA family oxidoreductase [Planctomycetota bacterium]|jgi:predicted dehydrogenase|nr:Gfo/Idh/MocA family oxidoreductase [Planctomycetota bacterium]